MADQKRVFNARRKDDTEVSLSVRKPTKQELEAADMEFASVFNRALLSGCPTRMKMNRKLHDNGVIDSADEVRMDEIRNEVVALDKRLKKLGTDEAKLTAEQKKEKKAAEQRRGVLMREFNGLRQDIDSMFSQTADSKAEDAQRNFLTACVIEYAGGDNDGERVFATVDAMLEAQLDDNDFVQRCMYEFMMLQADAPSDGDKLFAKADPAAEEGQEEQEEQQAPDTAADDAAGDEQVDLLGEPATAPSEPQATPEAPATGNDVIAM